MTLKASILISQEIFMGIQSYFTVHVRNVTDKIPFHNAHHSFPIWKKFVFCYSTTHSLSDDFIYFSILRSHFVWRGVNHTELTKALCFFPHLIVSLLPGCTLQSIFGNVNKFYLLIPLQQPLRRCGVEWCFAIHIYSYRISTLSVDHYTYLITAIGFWSALPPRWSKYHCTQGVDQ